MTDQRRFKDNNTNNNSFETTPLIVSSTSPSNTYRPGEGIQRLQEQARQFGLSRPRGSRQVGRVRRLDGDGGNALAGFFSDHTFSSAVMHSVGSLGQDEYVDSRGEVHLISIRERQQQQRRRTVASGATLSRENSIPSYGRLQDLFEQQQPCDGGVPLSENDGDDDGVNDDRIKSTTTFEVDGDDRYVVEDQVEGGSMTAAVFGIIKGTIGPAILYLPRGFQMAGWACAIPALLFATFSYLYSAHRLLECWRVEDARQRFLAQRMEEIQSLLEPNNVSTDGGSGVGRRLMSPSPRIRQTDAKAVDSLAAFSPKLLTYPELARRAFGSYAALIEFGIAAMQFGVCLTYLIFVPANLYASCLTLFGVAIPKVYFLIGMLCIEIPCSWIRDIRKLTPFNVLATLLIAYGLGSCLAIAYWYSYTQKEETLWESIISQPALQPTWFLFIGTAFFVFEGSITLVVPLQEAVYKKEDRERFPMINQHVTTAIVIFYIFFATICTAAFGDQVRTALTASLPGGIYSTSVQFAYSIAVIFTYPLQAFPALEVTLKGLNSGSNSNGGRSSSSSRGRTGGVGNHRPDREKEVWRRNFFATFLNIGLGIIAVLAIDYLGNVVSLLGSLVGMPIALIYPPMMHNILVKDVSSKAKCMNYFVAGVGAFATLAASYATIVNWNEGGET